VVGHGAADVNPPAGLLASVPANVLAPVSPAHDACPADLSDVAPSEGGSLGEGGWYVAPGYWMRSLRGVGRFSSGKAGLSGEMHHVTG